MSFPPIPVIVMTKDEVEAWMDCPPGTDVRLWLAGRRMGLPVINLGTSQHSPRVRNKLHGSPPPLGTAEGDT